MVLFHSGLQLLTWSLSIQNIIDDQEKTISQQKIQISSLNLEVDQLTKDRDALLDKIKKLENAT